jgi:uncharacterized membrane protein
MPGGLSNRTDLSRVQKIQRNAKIQNAPGGQYGQRNDLQTLAQGAPAPETASAVSANPAMSFTAAPAGAPQGLPQGAAIQSQSAFAPDTSGNPITHGAPGDTAGAGPEVLGQPVDTPDNGEILARAMYLKNPTPQLRLIVEAYNEARQ